MFFKKKFIHYLEAKSLETSLTTLLTNLIMDYYEKFGKWEYVYKVYKV